MHRWVNMHSRREERFAAASVVLFSLIALVGCSVHSTTSPPTTEPHKAIAVNAAPTTISAVCLGVADYHFSPGYEVQKPGTAVSPSSVLSEFNGGYNEAFVGATQGYALANVNSQTYPAVTLDDGHTWRINGPMLYRSAADAGQAVSEIGAAPPDTVFIWGSGNLIDFSPDGGMHWCEANMGGSVLSMGASSAASVWAILGSPPVTGQSSGPATTYISDDGGRTWVLTGSPR
jgi:hypothetical protein